MIRNRMLQHRSYTDPHFTIVTHPVLAYQVEVHIEKCLSKPMGINQTVFLRTDFRNTEPPVMNHFFLKKEANHFLN